MAALEGSSPLPLPTLPNTNLGIFISFIAPFFLILVLFHYVNKRSRVPVNWPLFGMLPGLVVNTPRLYDWTTNVVADLGGNFEFKGPWFSSMNIFFTADPANMSHIFSLNRKNYPKGDDFADIFEILGDGLLISDGESWVLQRKRAHSHLSSNNFRSFAADSARKKMAQGFLPLLNSAASQGAAVDLQDLFLRFTLDVTCMLLFGCDTNSLSPGLPTLPFAEAVDDFTEVVLYRHLLPKRWWKLMKWLGVGSEKKFATASRVMDEFMFQQISKKKEEMKKKKKNNYDKEFSPTFDLLSSYIEDPMVEKMANYDVFLRDTVFNMIFAGRDTSAIGLSWFFYMLTQHRDVEAKILDELRAIPPATNNALNDDNELITFDAKDLNKLIYLQAAIYESLRLFPPAPFDHRDAKEADEMPSGHRVQPGMQIIVSMHAMGRIEKVWGKDCNEFKPERWITKGGMFQYEPSYKYLVFGSGPRMCIGKDSALQLTKVVAAALVYNFEVEVVEGHVVEPRLSMLSQMKNGLKVKVKRRKVAG